MRAEVLARALSRTGDHIKRDTEEMKQAGGHDMVVIFMTFTCSTLYRLSTEVLNAQREDNPERKC